METIGSKIKAIRKEKGITQEDLAKKAGIPYATLMKIENGTVKNPTIKTVQKLAEALEVNIEELIVEIKKEDNGNT